MIIDQTWCAWQTACDAERLAMLKSWAWPSPLWEASYAAAMTVAVSPRSPNQGVSDVGFLW
jgi:hypothetical protein